MTQVVTVTFDIISTRYPTPLPRPVKMELIYCSIAEILGKEGPDLKYISCFLTNYQQRNATGAVNFQQNSVKSQGW